MGRTRNQRGSLKCIGTGEKRRWRGSWYVYRSNGKRRSREKILGRCSELSKVKARALLQQIIDKETRQANVVNNSLTGRLSHSINPKLSANAKRGAVCELLVCADLLSNGFEVFRAVNHCGSCDIVAMNDEGFVRIEVKSVGVHEDRIMRDIRRNAGRFDLLALVDSDGRIKYVPHSAVMFGRTSEITGIEWEQNGLNSLVDGLQGGDK